MSGERNAFIPKDAFQEQVPGETDSMRREREAMERLAFAIDRAKMFREQGPKILGRGGEHIVVGFEKAPHVVQKINMAYLWGAMKEEVNKAEEEWRTPEMVFLDTGAFLEKKVESDQRDLMAMHRYFGDMAPNETVQVRSTAVDATLFDAFMNAWSSRASESDMREKMKRWFRRYGDSHVLPLFTRTASRAPEYKLTAGGAFPLQGLYMEPKVDAYDSDYGDTMSRFVSGNDRFTPIRRLLPKVFRPTTIAWLERIGQDEELKKTLVRFVRGAIDYTKATGRILDLAGKDNINVHRANGSAEGPWRVFFLDAQYPDFDDHAVFDAGKEALARALTSFIRGAFNEKSPPCIYQWDEPALLNALLYMRCINALAELTGIPERLQVNHGNVEQLTAPYWTQMISSLHVVSEAGGDRVPAWGDMRAKKAVQEPRVGAVQPPSARERGRSAPGVGREERWFPEDDKWQDRTAPRVSVQSEKTPSLPGGRIGDQVGEFEAISPETPNDTGNQTVFLSSTHTTPATVPILKTPKK